MTFLRSPDVAVDLGTARFRVAGARSGVCECGANPPAGEAMRQGVVADADSVVRILRPMIRKRRQWGASTMRALACAPTDVSALERNLVRSCLLEAGASSVVIVPEPLAAAVGAGVDIGSRYSNFIVDFGEGVTDCAVIRNGRIAASLAVRAGCADLREIVSGFSACALGLEIGTSEAERVLRALGFSRTGAVMLRGKSPEGGEATAFLSAAELYPELQSTVARMIQPIRELLENMGAGSGAEVIEDGIFLTGGGALLPGLRTAVAEATGIETRIVEDPLRSVIRGARRMLPFAASLDLWKLWGSHQREMAL